MFLTVLRARFAIHTATPPLSLQFICAPFLVVRDVRVKGSLVSPGYRFVSCAKIKYTFGHILIFIHNSFFQSGILGYFQEFGKRHPQVLIHSRRCVIFEKKNPKFRLSHTSAIENYQCTCLILTFVCMPSPGSRSSWIERSLKECRKSHSHSLISCNSHSRILPNVPGKSVQPVSC